MGIRSAFSGWCLERGETSLILHSVIVFTFTSSYFECRKLWKKNEQLWNVIFKPCVEIKNHPTTTRAWNIISVSRLWKQCSRRRPQSFLPFTQHLYVIWRRLLNEEKSCSPYPGNENLTYTKTVDKVVRHVTFSILCFPESITGTRSVYFTVVHFNEKDLDMFIWTVKTIFNLWVWVTQIEGNCSQL